MLKDECFQLGYIIKAHALKGEVQILLDVDEPERYRNLESVLVEKNGNLIPFFLEYISISANKAIVAFEEIQTREDAEEIASSSLYLPLSFLPDLGKGKYYFHDLVGCEIFEGSNKIALVKSIDDSGAQTLIVADHAGTEILIPLTEEIVNNVDVSKKVIEVTLPTGLLDIYLG